jgi:hypothetical protein
MESRFAIENLERIKEQCRAEVPVLGFCACGDFAVTVKAGPYTGNPFHLCAAHSSLWTEQRLGISKAAS